MELSITVPSSLKDISLGDYQKFIKIVSDKDITDIFIRQKMIQIFCNIPLLAVNKMTRKDFTLISNQIITVLQEKPKLNRLVELKGKTYGFVPNLNKDLTMGEFVDLDTYMTDWDNFNKAMAVLYRPVTVKKKDSYRIEDYDSDNVDNDLMLSMDMQTVMGSVVFFWTLSRQLLAITPKYLQQQLAKNQKAAEVLEKNGVGISTFINLLEGVCLKLEMLAGYHWERLSYS